MSSKKVLLVGDYIQDVNCYGRITRLCPEDPTAPIFVHDHGSTTPGGMGLVAENLKAFGLDGTVIQLSYSRKTRYWAGRHLVMREDEDSLQFYPANLPTDGFDAIVISDYNKGGIASDEFAQLLIRSHKKVFVDTKRPNPEVYKGAYAIFPNAAEFPFIKDSTLYKHVIRKAGPDGCYVDGQHVPGTPVEEFDVTGAGDVFLAAFVAMDLEGWCLEDCARFANQAAAISVQHQGGYVLTEQDIKTLER